MTDEMINDFDKAVEQLRRTFAKYGFEQPKAIVLSDDPDDFFKMKNAPATMKLFYDPNPMRMPANVACKIGGMAFIRDGETEWQNENERLREALKDLASRAHSHLARIGK